MPYNYTLIVWAVVFGYSFSATIPETLMLVGAAIIVAAGMFSSSCANKPRRRRTGHRSRPEAARVSSAAA